MVRVAIVVVLFLVSPVWGDGQLVSKKVKHTGKVLNVSAYPDYLFYAQVVPFQKPEKAPPAELDLAPLQDNGLMAGHDATSGPLHLFAVPKTLHKEGTKAQASWFDGSTPNVLRSEPIYLVNLISPDDPRTELETHFKVTIQNNLLLLTRERDDSLPPQEAKPIQAEKKEIEDINKLMRQWALRGSGLLVALAILWWFIRKPRRK